jgi:regulator of sirC expression with transglutaminase-like and TPR domain
MEAPEVWRVFGRYTKDQDKVSNFFFSDHSTHEARIKNLTKAINADYRADVARNTLRTGEEEHEKAVDKLKQQTARANFQKQEYAQAARGLAQTLERNPNDAKAHYDMGRVLWAQGGAKNAEQVLEAFGSAIQLDPKLAEPWRDAGLVFYELRDVNRAAKAFERYLQLAPDAPEGPKIRAFLNAMQAPPLQ